MRAYDTEFIAFAEEAAEKSDCKMKMGACLVKNKRVVSTGYNRWFGLNKVLTKYGLLWSLHAEMAALSNAPYNAGYGGTIYISRMGNKMAKPCNRCSTIMAKAGISRVVYTAGGWPVSKYIEVRL
jgi:deoxycytidylate deaminase